MTPQDNSITIAVPALNEQDHLAGAVDIAVAQASRWFDAFEVLVFNDGSTDGTGRVADALAARYPRVTAFHHERPAGLGGVIREGLQRATMRYFMWVDGEGATTAEALDRIFAQVGKADLVIPYPENQNERPPHRQVISRVFQGTLNLLFGLDLRYYNHLAVCPTALAKRIPVKTDSHAHQAERLIKLIKCGCSYVQVGVRDNYETEGATTAFKLSNVVGVAAFFLDVFWDVRVRRKYRLGMAAGWDQ